jgi:hypothetical protein
MEERQVEIIPTCRMHVEFVPSHELFECYKTTNENQKEEDPRNVHVSEIEGECDVVGPPLESDIYVCYHH